MAKQETKPGDTKLAAGLIEAARQADTPGGAPLETNLHPVPGGIPTEPPAPPAVDISELQEIIQDLRNELQEEQQEKQQLLKEQDTLRADFEDEYKRGQKLAEMVEKLQEERAEFKAREQLSPAALYVSGAADLETPETLEAKYGKGYVFARKGDETTYFTARAWQNLVEKGGWVKELKTPPEIAHLQTQLNERVAGPGTN